MTLDYDEIVTDARTIRHRFSPGGIEPVFRLTHNDVPGRVDVVWRTPGADENKLVAGLTLSEATLVLVRLDGAGMRITHQP